MATDLMMSEILGTNSSCSTISALPELRRSDHLHEALLGECSNSSNSTGSHQFHQTSITKFQRHQYQDQRDANAPAGLAIELDSVDIAAGHFKACDTSKENGLSIITSGAKDEVSLTSTVDRLVPKTTGRRECLPAPQPDTSNFSLMNLLCNLASLLFALAVVGTLTYIANISNSKHDTINILTEATTNSKYAPNITTLNKVVFNSVVKLNAIRVVTISRKVEVSIILDWSLL
ncbi:unnamed protein product [Protopolystoma xenopodis]|uniref:Uncharacterized protein n=1 Tax=Protopolystoma xenopodis TaxID=117903 RepID=A0A448XJK5_9PLAT|nr:unnamed protein product [Protopolystoma xenopodis]